MQRGQQVPLCYIQCKSLSQSSRHATLMSTFSSVCSQAVSFFLLLIQTHLSSSQRSWDRLYRGLPHKSFLSLITKEDPCNKTGAWIMWGKTAGFLGGKLKLGL